MTVASFADVVITNNITLTEDTDWSNEKVVFDPGTSIYLEGHTLKVSDISITNKFVEMEYYETDGNQWFSMPKAPAGNDTVEMKAALTAVNVNQCLFCARSGPLSNTYTLLALGSNLRMDYCTKQSTFTGATPSANEICTFRMAATSGYAATLSKISSDLSTTNELGTISGSSFTPPTGFWLFRLNTNGTGVNGYNAKCRFYSFKVWGVDGTLKNDVVPVYNVKEKKVYLYDRVTGDLLANQGTADSTGNGYCALDYVDCKGAYVVNSGFTPACTNRIEIKARCVNTGATQLLFNSRYDAKNRAFSAWVIDTGKLRFDYGSQQSEQVDVSFDEAHVFVMSPNSSYTATITVDGTTVATLVNGSSFTAAYTLDVCGISYNNTCPLYGNFYYMKVYASDASDAKLLSELVPAYSIKDDAVGMFDRVAQKFRANSMLKGSSPSMDCAFIDTVDANNGTVNFNVASDTVFTNDAFSIRGDMKVVKDGEGTFVAANANQNYTGGFVVTNGIVKAASDLGTLFGSTNRAITVAEGAVFDFNHNTLLSPYAILLNGGTLTNTGDEYGQGDISMKTVTLGADSYFDTSKSLGLTGGENEATSLDLGGHTLYVTNTPSGAIFRLTNTTITNGTMVVRGNGIIMMRGKNGVVAYESTLDLEGRLGIANAPTCVGNLILRDGCTVFNGLHQFSVAGTFKCETTNGFPKVYLEPNSTWDLSENESTFNSVNPLDSSWYIMMADGEQGQTVNIKLGDRAVSSSPIVSWTNTDYTNVTYKLVDSAGGYRLTARADGLYATSGLVFIVR